VMDAAPTASDPAHVPSVLWRLFAGERRVRAMGLAIGLLTVLVVVIVLATGGGGGNPKPAAAPQTPVTTVPDGATPVDDAHNLAVWIRAHTR
jgi:hypothetical protein